LKVNPKVPAAVLALCAPLVAYYEGYVPHSYADPIGIPTACYGHTGPEVRLGQKYTRAECQALLEGDLAEAYAAVRRCIRSPNDHQAAALTSAAYNAGPAIVCGSTLQRKANAGDWAGACAQLDRWVYAGGIKLRGLVRRRAAERALCEGRA
jgi:lysozyme